MGSISSVLVLALLGAGIAMGGASMMNGGMAGMTCGSSMTMTPQQCQAMHDQMSTTMSGMTPEQCQAMHDQMSGDGMMSGSCS